MLTSFTSTPAIVPARPFTRGLGSLGPCASRKDCPDRRNRVDMWTKAGPVMRGYPTDHIDVRAAVLPGRGRSGHNAIRADYHPFLQTVVQGRPGGLDLSVPGGLRLGEYFVEYLWQDVESEVFFAFYHAAGTNPFPVDIFVRCSG